MAESITQKLPPTDNTKSKRLGRPIKATKSVSQSRACKQRSTKGDIHDETVKQGAAAIMSYVEQIPLDTYSGKRQFSWDRDIIEGGFSRRFVHLLSVSYVPYALCYLREYDTDFLAFPFLLPAHMSKNKSERKSPRRLFYFCNGNTQREQEHKRGLKVEENLSDENRKIALCMDKLFSSLGSAPETASEGKKMHKKWEERERGEGR